MMDSHKNSLTSSMQKSFSIFSQTQINPLNMNEYQKERQYDNDDK